MTPWRDVNWAPLVPYHLSHHLSQLLTFVFGRHSFKKVEKKFIAPMGTFSRRSWKLKLRLKLKHE